jgi:hypothetical protein
MQKLLKIAHFVSADVHTIRGACSNPNQLQSHWSTQIRVPALQLPPANTNVSVVALISEVTIKVRAAIRHREVTVDADSPSSGTVTSTLGALTVTLCSEDN